MRTCVLAVVLMISTQADAACVGLPKAEKDACLQRIVSGVKPLSQQEAALEDQRYRTARSRMEDEVGRYQDEENRKAQVQIELQKERNAAVARQAAQRPVIIQQTVDNSDPLDFLRGVQARPQQAAAPTPPPAQRPMNCYTYGGGYIHCN